MRLLVLEKKTRLHESKKHLGIDAMLMLLMLCGRFKVCVNIKEDIIDLKLKPLTFQAFNNSK